MQVVGSQGDHPPPDDRFSAIDSLNEFAIEESDRADPSLGRDNLFVPVRVSPPPIVTSHDLAGEPDVRPRARWLFAAVALVAGLLAGFAAGMALAPRGGDDPYAAGGALAANRVDVTLEPAALQSVHNEPSPEPAAETTDDVAIDDVPRPTDTTRGTQQPDATDAPLGAAAPSAHTASTGGFGVLHLESYPAGAQVYVDDRPVVTTPFRLSGVAPGLHILRMEMEGYRSWSTSVRLGAGALVRVSAPLEGVVGR